MQSGGEGGIRTHGTVTRTTVFETVRRYGFCCGGAVVEAANVPIAGQSNPRSCLLTPKRTLNSLPRRSTKMSLIIIRYEKHFEAAATWYRLDCRGSNIKRATPSVIKDRMDKIARAARRLLKWLDIDHRDNYRYAADGPRDFALLEFLASAENGNEDEVTRATARVEQLVEILDAADAAQKLEHLARKAADDAVQIGELTVPKRHRGHAAENDWIAVMMSTYKKLTGKEPRTSVIAPGRSGRGKAAGPLIRFLEAAGKPLGMKYSANSWRGRVEDIRTGGRRLK